MGGGVSVPVEETGGWNSSLVAGAEDSVHVGSAQQDGCLERCGGSSSGWGCVRMVFHGGKQEPSCLISAGAVGEGWESHLQVWQ